MYSSIRRLPLDGLRPDEAEAAIAESPVERLYFYDRRRRQVAIFEGEEGHVFFALTDAERRRVIDGLVIHNHPPDRNLSVDDPRYDAASFSPFDWRTAIELDVSVMIIVSPTWRHQLRRPLSGWHAAYRSLDDFLDMLTLLVAYVEEDDKRRAAAGVTTKEAAEALRMREVSRTFAGEIEASYIRERRQ